MARYSTKEQDFINECRAKNLEGVIDLLKTGSTASICNAVVNQGLAIASDSGCLGIVKYLVEKRHADIHKNENIALCLATGKGHLNVVTYLVEKCQARVNAVSEAALYCAADKGHKNTVKYLIEQGADYKFYQEKNKKAYRICHEISQDTGTKESTLTVNVNVEKLRSHSSERSVRRRPAPARKM